MKSIWTVGAVLALWATPALPQAPAPSPSGAVQTPNAAQLEAARALDTFDFQRLASDRAYAESMLRHVDALSPLSNGNPSGSAGLQGARALVLATLGRQDESRAAIRSVLAAGLADAQPYVLAWAAASHVPDADLMLTVVEAVARNVSPADRATILPAFAPPMLHSMNRDFRARRQDAQRHRLAETLAALRWPDDREPEARDFFRKQLLDQRLSQGRRDEAAQIVATITTPEVVLPILLLRRYDGLMSEAARSQQALERLAAERGSLADRLLNANPTDYGRVLMRAQYLRSVGRESEAYAILTPFLRDVVATSAHDIQGVWIINEAAYSLLSLGRGEEAVDLMSQLVAIDISSSPELIGPGINHAAILWQAGRATESLAHIERLDAITDEFASNYGKMWISSTAVCVLASLGRNEQAITRLRQMQASPGDNPAALTRALLCMNDIDAAERLIISRLESDDPEEAVLALQNYRAGGADVGPTTPLYRRLLQLRERPAVRAALDRVGRVLTLPIARIYYGQF